MKKLNKTLLSKLDSTTIRFQKIIIDRLKLYDFAKSAIDSYCKDKAKNLDGYDFKEFKIKFKLVSFKQNKEIKSINYREIITLGNNFIENELADSIFVLNLSTFETWLLTILKHCFLENPEIIFHKSDKKVDVSMIKGSNDLDELWEKIIDDYLRSLPYSGMKKNLNVFLKYFKIDKSKITPNIIEKINENSFCRNIIVHNQKKVNETYIKNCREFARFKEGDIIKVTENILFEQGDNLLRLMQDFRKNITS